MLQKKLPAGGRAEKIRPLFKSLFSIATVSQIRWKKLDAPV
jgi:hypothetical protein